MVSEIDWFGDIYLIVSTLVYFEWVKGSMMSLSVSSRCGVSGWDQGVWIPRIPQLLGVQGTQWAAQQLAGCGASAAPCCIEQACARLTTHAGKTSCERKSVCSLPPSLSFSPVSFSTPSLSFSLHFFFLSLDVLCPPCALSSLVLYHFLCTLSLSFILWHCLGLSLVKVSLLWHVRVCAPTCL